MFLVKKPGTALKKVRDCVKGGDTVMPLMRFGQREYGEKNRTNQEIIRCRQCESCGFRCEQMVGEENRHMYQLSGQEVNTEQHLTSISNCRINRGIRDNICNR